MLRPVSLRPTPPPAPTTEPETPRKELKGILKTIQNIADIEKSVANMFSQIDQKQIPITKVMKSRNSVDSLDSLDLLDAISGVGAEAEGGGDAKGQEADEAPGRPNKNMNPIVEELEKRFPSQSTIL